MRGLTLVAALVALAAGLARAEDRIPRPDFGSGYVLPALQIPAPRSPVLAYVDVAALALALAVASWLALRRRSRTGMFLLGAASLVYFGFVRRGCVCPVGSLQNVLYALVEPSYAIPAPVIAFFLLPLAFALLGGRTFCAGVCPLGAIQDFVLIRPVRLPAWLTRALGLLPPVYLGLAVLSVLMRSDFLICRFDPFVGFFRFSAELDMALAGVAILALATVVGRPYCRFLCPYGVLLRLASRLSWRHLSTTPTECVNCGLCVKSCPFGAVTRPEEVRGSSLGATELRGFALALLCVPLAGLVGAVVGYGVHPFAARMSPTVRIAREAALGTELGQTFLVSGTPVEELLARAAAVTAAYAPATAALGAYVGLVLAGGVAATMVRRARPTHAPHRALCLSCGRCFAACPKEQEVRKTRQASRERRILSAMTAPGRSRAGA